MPRPTIKLIPLRKDRGFTMVELMLVIIIVGILTSVAIPSFRSFMTNQRIKNASFDIIAMITFTRSEALKRNTNVTLNFDPALNALLVTTTINGVTTTLKQQAMFTGVTLQCVDTTAHAYVNCPNGGIVYQGSGRLVSAFGPLEISTINATDTTSSNWRCITLDLSGRPRSTKGAC